MRLLAVALATLILAVGVVGAADDSAIMQFASGVLAGSLLADNVASIDGNTLIITSQLGEYSDGKVGSIGFDLWNMASSAEKIITKYPERFKQVDLKILNSNGNTVIGMMSIVVQG